MRDHHATLGRGKGKLSRVIRAHQPGLRSSGHVNATAAKTGSDTGGNVFVQVKSDPHPSGCFPMILTPLRIKLRRVISARFVYKRALLTHLRLDLLDVIEIPCERGVYVGESD